jgi:hypothetical protein
MPDFEKLCNSLWTTKQRISPPWRISHNQYWYPRLRINHRRWLPRLPKLCHGRVGHEAAIRLTLGIVWIRDAVYPSLNLNREEGLRHNQSECHCWDYGSLEEDLLLPKKWYLADDLVGWIMLLHPVHDMTGLSFDSRAPPSRNTLTRES